MTSADLRCRSGDGCDEPTVENRKFCQAHAEQLDAVRVRISGSATGGNADRVRGRWALALAHAVWSGTPTAKLPAVIDVAVSHPGYRKALRIAEGNHWIVKPADGRGWERGSTIPPGFVATAAEKPEPAPAATDAPARLPRAVRVERLRALVEERGEIPKLEAAKGIGLASAGGSFPRILKSAVAAGHCVSGTNVVGPASAAAA